MDKEKLRKIVEHIIYGDIAEEPLDPLLGVLGAIFISIDYDDTEGYIRTKIAAYLARVLGDELDMGGE